MDFLAPRFHFSSWLYSYKKNDTNEYPNIFISKIQYELISEYISIKKWYEYDTNEYLYQKIFEYPNIRHTLFQRMILQDILENCWRLYRKHWETLEMINFITKVFKSSNDSATVRQWIITMDNNGQPWTTMDNNPWCYMHLWCHFFFYIYWWLDHLLSIATEWPTL